MSGEDANARGPDARSDNTEKQQHNDFNASASEGASAVELVLAFVEQFDVPVFPVLPDPKNKKPLTRNGFYDASRDERQIRAWARTYPRCAWGMPTGAVSGYVLLDVDVKNAKRGDASLQALEAQHGALPRTPETTTPSGGRHIWFKYPGFPVKSTESVVGEGLDIRADGGYGLIPPSVINGVSYAFKPGCDPDDVAFADMPAWLIQSANTGSKSSSSNTDGNDASDQQSGKADAWLNAIHAGKGRHAAIRNLAARYVSFGLPISEILKLLQGQMNGAEAPGDAKWKEKYAEIPHAIESAIRKFQDEKTKQTNQPPLIECGFWAGDAKPTLDLPYIVKGIIYKPQLIVFWGAPGSGKSFNVAELMCCVGSGEPWRKRRTKKGVVLYVCAESSRAYVENRIAALMQENEKLRNADVFVVPLALDLLHEAKGDIDRVLDAVRVLEQQRGEVVLITVDTLNVTMGGGDENGADMGHYVGNIKRIISETNAAVLVVHHSGKDEARGMRGHSALLGAIDGELVIEGSESKRILRTGKVRDGQAFTDLFAFELRPVSLGEDADGDAITTCVVDSFDGDAMQTVRRQRTKHGLGRNQKHVIDAVTEAGGRIARSDLTAQLREQGMTKQRTYSAVNSLLALGVLKAFNDAEPHKVGFP